MNKVHQDTLTVTTTSQGLVPANVKRVSLWISIPTTNRLTISVRQTAVFGEGITLGPNSTPIRLSGTICTQQFTAILNAGSEVIAYVEEIEP